MNLSLFVNGSWTPGAGETISLTDPCTGENSPHVFSSATEEQAETALLTARKAFPDWASTDLEDRKVILRRYAELLEVNQDQIAATISADTGKPLWESKTEATAMRGKIEISITAQEKRCAEFGNNPSITRYRPHGVVVVLGPFNFPGHLPNGHIVPALLAGNTVVFKPSELTPRTANLMVKLLLEAQVPAGAIQLLHGKGNIGAYLTHHDLPDAIFFTGSSATGKRITAANAHRPGRMVALEMGGNNPLVIGDMNQLEATCLTIIQSAFITAGQRCTCARRLIIIENEQTDSLLERLIQMTQSIQVGCPKDDPPPFMGPVITPAAAQQVIDAQAQLINQGAQVLLEATLLKEGTGLVSPGILDVTDVQERSDQETFGPLLQVIRVANLDEAIVEANNTVYGLSAGIISNNANHYERFRNEVKAGLINWNQQLTGASSAAPFGV